LILYNRTSDPFGRHSVVVVFVFKKRVDMPTNAVAFIWKKRVDMPTNAVAFIWKEQSGLKVAIISPAKITFTNSRKQDYLYTLYIGRILGVIVATYLQ